MKIKNEKEGLEQFLVKIRQEKNWTYGDVASRLNKQMNNQNILEIDIKKWEYGLKYPDLDLIYELSNLYQIPVDDFIDAKDNSFKNGFLSIQFIKWFCFMLNLSIHTVIVLTAITYVLAVIFAFWFFSYCASRF